VTTLFADTVGFTAIAERLGEEGTFALIQPIYELMAGAVKEQGGSVKDFTGDGVMALFGAPEALDGAADALSPRREPLEVFRREYLVPKAIPATLGVFLLRWLCR
jgi:class 3 adenylate cyclase